MKKITQSLPKIDDKEVEQTDDILKSFDEKHRLFSKSSLRKIIASFGGKSPIDRITETLKRYVEDGNLSKENFEFWNVIKDKIEAEKD